MAVLTYKGDKYHTLAGNKIFDGSKWTDMSGDSKIFLDGAWHDFSWQKAQLPDVPDEPELPDWDDFTHLATPEPTVGTKYYMTPVGAGSKDGSSWDNAWSASQIHTAALSLSQNDRLYMAEGDYGTLSIPLQLPESTGIYGGFIEGDYSWETRDAFKHPTLLRGTGTAPFAVTGGEAAIILDGIAIDGFGESSATVYGYNMDIRNSSIVDTSDDLSSLSAFTNCRFSGVEGCTIMCARADSCYFRGDEDSYIKVYAREFEDSTALRCAPVYVRIEHRSVACFAVSIVRSVVSDLTSKPAAGSPQSEIIQACTAASSSTFVRVNANHLVTCSIGRVSGCTVIDSVCKVGQDSNVEPCSFSRSKVGGNIYNSIIFDCSTYENGSVYPYKCTIVKCSFTQCTELAWCTVVNCTIRDVNRIDLSILVNSDVTIIPIYGGFTPPVARVNLVLNSVVTVTYDDVRADFCTIVNSIMDVPSGRDNVFWNNNGTCVADGNAQSAYNSSNVLTLGTSNDITRFVGTGYAPAIGIQDIGECPDPITDSEGYAEYVASFGDWHPQADSFLVGRASDQSVSNFYDLDGGVRPKPATLGAYEPIPQEG